MLPPLPYDVTALEPLLDAETVLLHHSRHHAAYVAGANAAADMMRQIAEGNMPETLAATAAGNLAFNLAGHMLHTLYWGNLSPVPCEGPRGELADAINTAFGSYSGFVRLFRSVALGVRGSGWAVLASCWPPNATKMRCYPACGPCLSAMCGSMLIISAITTIALVMWMRS